MGNFFKLLFFCLILSGCTSLIYQPDKFLYAHPDQFKTKFDNFTFSSIDGTKLSAWKLISKTKNPKKLLIYFHGNAQNLTSHFVNTVWMTEYDYDILIFDYRGYGLSDGVPNPKSVAEDGLAFLNYSYTEFKKGGYEKFIIYTQSLGGAVALKSLEDFSHRNEISLLVLDSTFLSPRDVARDKTNRLMKYLVSDDYTANPELKHLTMPVLSIHATEDFVIAYFLGKDLFDSIPNPKKEFWTLDVKGHGDVFFVENQKYREKFLKYVENLP